MTDIIPSVPCESRPTAAHGGIRPVTRGIVLHSTRGPTHPKPGEVISDTLQREYEVAVQYMQNAANQVSPHFCVGAYRVARMVGDSLVAWHAQEHNQTHLGIEIAQPAYLPPFVPFQYDATADICARWCLKYGIPAVHVTNSDHAGIIGHEETDQGRRDGKSDPGYLWDWGRFIALTQARVEELSGMNAQEKAKIDEYTKDIMAVEKKLIVLCDELQRAVGATGLEEDLRRLHGEYWTPMALIRQLAGLS